MYTKLFALCALAPTLAGQTPQPATPSDDLLIVPVHAALEPRADAALWAAGRDYKASFGDAFADALPFRWTTRAVRVGDVPCADAAIREIRHGADHVELDRGAVIERYDLRPDGVEQSFVVNVAGVGELVVEGSIATPLAARRVEGRHGALAFRGPGDAVVVTYGAAFAVDAKGRRAPMRTAFDGTTVRLSIGADWVRDAAWPITVDPLVQTGQAITGNRAPGWTALARDDERNQQLVAFTRTFAANDLDVYAAIVGDDGAFAALAFADLDGQSSAERPSVAFVDGADRWVVAYEQHAQVSTVQVYLHEAASRAVNSGTRRMLPSHGFGMQNQQPVVGGTPGYGSGTHACIAYRVDASLQPRPNGARSEIHTRILDAATGAFGARAWVSEHTFTDIDCEYPAITPTDGGGTGSSWLVAFQQYDNGRSNDAWDVHVRRVHHDGSYDGRRVFVADGRRHALCPLVAGRDGRYLVAWTERNESGKTTAELGERISVQRMDWPSASATSTVEARRTLVQDPNVASTTGRARHGLAYDHRTLSHWTLAWTNTALGAALCARLGHDGDTVAAATLARSLTAPASAPAVTFDDDADRFLCAFAQRDTSGSVRFAALEYEAATAAAYGSSCAGTLQGANANGTALPFAGSEFFEIRLLQGRPSAAAVLLAGFGSAALPIPGLPGCALLLDPSQPLVEAGRATTSALGTGHFPVPFPGELLRANLFWQAVQLDARGVTTSGALETRIR